jgi:bisphosphoglycerate-dependent phosphoglycerate mutase
MSNKTIIYLVRHGETEWNVEHRMQGHQDSPLTNLGIKQAQWLGDSLEDKPPYIHPVSLCHIELVNEYPTIILHGDISHYKEVPVAD